MSRILAILCSGQGAQHRAMFDLVSEDDAAQPVFAAAARQLDGIDPRRLLADARDELLFSNRVGQILCCTQALAAWAALGRARPPRAVIAGYSAGELAAWGCAGCLQPGQVLDLAAARAEAMDACAPVDSGLMAVLGLEPLRRDALLAAHEVALAIVNAPDHVVLGGARPALRGAALAARAGGAARCVMLRVAVPSHTPALAAAVAPFRAALAQAAPSRPAAGIRLLSGRSGDRVHDMAEGCDQLAAQIAQTIDWGACLAACREAGADTVLELGPGTALSRMAAALPFASCRAFEDFHTLDGVRRWLLANR